MTSNKLARARAAAAADTFCPTPLPVLHVSSSLPPPASTLRQMRRSSWQSACTLSNRGSSTTAKAAKAHAASLTSIHEIAEPLSRASSMASTTALISCCTLKKSCFLSSSVDGASRRQRTAHSFCDTRSCSTPLSPAQRSRNARKAATASWVHSGLGCISWGTSGSLSCEKTLYLPSWGILFRAGRSLTSAQTTLGEWIRSH
mmetsp:Transcript_43322/g.114017  ORF Transcript_43322/g.114017 Transcript_43322/m.114017 type:complete len:202 (-) Transcript_43322:191-796(-)